MWYSYDTVYKDCSKFSVNIDWFIDFNGMSTHLGLFYAKWLGNHIHIYIFLCSC